MTRAWALVLGASLAAAILLAWGGALRPPAEAPRGAESPTGFPGEWRSATELAGATRLENVSRLWSAHWGSERGFLVGTVPYSYLEPAEPLRSRLAEGAAPPLRVEVTMLDVGAQWREVGFVNDPFDPNSAQVLHRWLPTGRAEWRTESFLVPGGVESTGPWYVSYGAPVAGISLAVG